MNIPSGNVTFLFTDIEGSTKLAQKFQDTTHAAIEKHHEILYDVLDSHNGFVFKINGDAFCCAFENAIDAVTAAFEIQKRLNTEKWIDASIRVRMGIHTGDAQWKQSDYLGFITLAKTQRIMSVASGGQILISKETYEIAKEKSGSEISFRDLGDRRLKDIIKPVRLYQFVCSELPSDFPPLKTLDARSNNLPIQISSFIGRKKEISEIKDLLSESRLLTLLGTGGTGKTRLSLKVGADVIDDFANGVWFIELGQLNDPFIIVNEISSALNLKEDGSRKVLEIIIDFLKEKELLMILDNCEHLLNECAKIIQVLLKSCPKLKIITSSRESLRIPGEKIYQVPVLSMPDIKGTITPESLNQFESACLFIDRAVLVKNDFEVNEVNAPLIAQLCIQLDGIPLALELAAARIKALTVEKILKNISKRFQLLTGGSRTALPRQQTLRSLIDWSYELLSEKEKLLFQHLSVFSGGWSLVAAEEVCTDEELENFEILDLLSHLVEKSIVISSEKNGTNRYSMLETIRQYSDEKLKLKNEFNQKHFDYFLKLSTREDWNTEIDEQSDKEIQTEQDNLRKAIKWSLENSPEQSIGLVTVVASYWELKGNYAEAFESLKKVLSLNLKTDEKLNATAYLNAGFIASLLNEINTAENYLTMALEYFRNSGDKIKTVECLSTFGILNFNKGEFGISQKYFEEALTLAKETNNEFTLAEVLNNFAVLNINLGNTENSYKQTEEALRIYRKLNKKSGLSKSLLSMGGIYFQNGDLGKARSCFEEGLAMARELGDRYSETITLYNLGNLNYALNNFSEAEYLYESASLKAKEYGFTIISNLTYVKLGDTSLKQNNNSKAKEIFLECIKMFNRDSERQKLALSIFGLGNYYFTTRKYEVSAKLFFLAQNINEALKVKLSKSRLDEFDNIIKDIKTKLGENKFNQLFNEVKSMKLENAAEIALSL